MLSTRSFRDFEQEADLAVVNGVLGRLESDEGDGGGGAGEEADQPAFLKHLQDIASRDTNGGSRSGGFFRGRHVDCVGGVV